jgi:bifunctional DNA-binding transcriptional regulator/antitoxin component of YhaV-PrlF toxin-antitoxin module
MNILTISNTYGTLVIQNHGGYTMVYVVGQKGQVVIAKEIRDRLGVEPGWVALQRLEGDHVEVFFIPPEHRKSLRGSLAEHIKVRPALGKEWDRARDKAWRKAVKEKLGVEEQDS